MLECVQVKYLYRIITLGLVDNYKRQMRCKHTYKLAEHPDFKDFIVIKCGACGNIGWDYLPHAHPDGTLEWPTSLPVPKSKNKLPTYQPTSVIDLVDDQV